MNQPVKHHNSVAIRCKLLLASNWPPNSSVASKNQLFPQWQAQRTFFGRPWAKSASAARLCGFFHRPPTAFDFRHLPLTSKTRQFLKIWWWQHRVGSTPTTGTSPKARRSRAFGLVCAFPGKLVEHISSAKTDLLSMNSGRATENVRLSGSIPRSVGCAGARLVVSLQ